VWELWVFISDRGRHTVDMADAFGTVEQVLGALHE